MKTILFNERTYMFTIIGCFTTLILASILLSGLLPSRPRIDYQIFYGSDYLIYLLSNLIMLGSLVLIVLCMGLLMAERIIRIRGYHDILQKERKDT